MSELTTFESRQGVLSCTPVELYHFLNDIRNFEQFIPADRFTDITVERDTCSFSVPMMGKVVVNIREKKEFCEVVYGGNALVVNDFSLIVAFKDAGQGTTVVKLSVIARLNPFLKMAASEPVQNLLETLVGEMEKFRGWSNVRQDN